MKNDVKNKKKNKNNTNNKKNNNKIIIKNEKKDIKINNNYSLNTDDKKVNGKTHAKKIIFICSIFIILITLLLFIFYYFFGGNYLKITKSGSDKEIKVLVGNSNYEIPKVTCKFFNKELSNKELKIVKNIDTNKLGKQEVEYECKKSFFKKNIVIKYNVVDEEPPILEVDSDENISIYVGDEYKEPIFKATDNYDGDITDKAEKTGEVDNKTAGIYEINYSVKDSSLNEASKKITVEVKVRPVQTNNKNNNNNVTYNTSSNMSCGTPGVIYLTFDDGPNNTYTPVILDVLKKYGVKATFFITSSGSDDLVKREYDEGHAVGIHTSTHQYNVVYASDEAFWNDMNIVKDRIERITGVSPTLMRFPGGSSNTVSRHYSVGIMGRLASQIEEKGYGYFDWNISSGDAGGTTDPNVEYNNVVNALSKSRGNVILMHDIKYHTSQAIDSIVKYGIENGYTFDVLNTSIICHQAINN